MLLSQAPRSLRGGSGRGGQARMAPQQLASAVVTTTSPYTGPPVGSVPEVIKRLEEIQSYAEAHPHVNFDRAVAVADTCTQLGSAPAIGAKHQSYQEINKIFAEEMQSLREHFESTWERLIDQVVLGRVVNKMDDWIVVATRDVAWEAAEHLWNLRQRGEEEASFIARIDGLAGEAGRAVLLPVL